MRCDITSGNRGTLLFVFAMLTTACGGDSDGGGSGGGQDEDTGSSHGSVGATSGSGGGTGGGCFKAFPGAWTLQATAGPSQCKGFGPIECDVAQQACTVTIESDHLGGLVSVTIDAEGKTDSAQVSIGDGVVAKCHAEFSQQFGTSVGDIFSMTLVCSAMGVECEFGESQIFSD